jgi:hypothetical protein
MITPGLSATLTEDQRLDVVSGHVTNDLASQSWEDLLIDIPAHIARILPVSNNHFAVVPLSKLPHGASTSYGNLGESLLVRW